MGYQFPWKKVVKSETRSHQHGESRIDTLECGHVFCGKGSSTAKRRRCRQCPMINTQIVTMDRKGMKQGEKATREKLRRLNLDLSTGDAEND